MSTSDFTLDPKLFQKFTKWLRPEINLSYAPTVPWNIHNVDREKALVFHTCLICEQ